ncbi:MAG: zinc ABC transporter substrate-binding protein [Verrucomicrobiota bacterium]
MNFYKSLSILFSTVLVALFLTACGTKETETEEVSSPEAPHKIVCTVGMITDIVRNVAGDLAELEGIIGEGVDPHLYKPTRADVVKLSNADLIFYNGLLLEGKMSDVLVRVATQGKPVHAVTETILEDPDYLMADESEPEYTDPHVWMDVKGWLTGVNVVANVLASYDPAHADEYFSNARAYIEKLEKLHAYALKATATIPESQRVLVTAHDAFQYLGRAYDIEVRGIQGISTESEAGVRDLEELVDFIVDLSIPAVFVESSVADKNVRALVEGAKARGHDVVIGGELFSDAMGEPGSYEGTYIGMIDHNVTTITNALGGKANGFNSE